MKTETEKFFLIDEKHGTKGTTESVEPDTIV